MIKLDFNMSPKPTNMEDSDAKFYNEENYDSYDIN